MIPFVFGLLLLWAAWWTARKAWRIVNRTERWTGSFGDAAGISTVLAAFALCAYLIVPKIALLMDLSARGATHGSLGGIRSALSIYYGDMKRKYPADLSALTKDGKYLSEIPPAAAPPYHGRSPAVRYGKSPDDAGGWLYDNVQGDPDLGALWVNCTHTDYMGSAWSSY
ncbi:MAG: hypothetical protein HY077_01780 [Elusimicrobia bacterium]|nr:hypothetical protein [Elusimicrobiota bacterium]